MVEQRTAPASLAGFSLLHVDALVGQAPGDRLIDAVDGPGNPGSDDSAARHHASC